MNVEPRSKGRSHYGYVAVPSSVTLPLRLFDLIQFHRADTHASGTTSRLAVDISTVATNTWTVGPTRQQETHG
jgi:hypothetical protein